MGPTTLEIEMLLGLGFNVLGLRVLGFEGF
jgi:hypothetical protein